MSVNRIREKLNKQLFYFLTGLLLLLIGSPAFATTVVISPNTVISADTTYVNVTLDMSNGSFIIKDGASLKISNSTINGTLTKDNPILFNVEKGKIDLINN